MAAISGKLARIRYTAAVATSSTNQACTLSSADDITLTINATGRRRWDPTSTHVHVYGGGSSSTAISSTDYVVDHALGRIRFTTAHTTAPTKAYTMDIPWLATSYLADAKAWSLEVRTDMLEVTSFATQSTGTALFRSYVPGVADATISISKWFNSSSTGPVFIDRAILGLPFYLELIVNSTDQGGYVCYGNVQTDGMTVDVGGAVAEEVTFKPTGAVYWTT
jgi:hypothetical protein